MDHKEFIENLYSSRKDRILVTGLYHRSNETVSVNLPLKRLIQEFESTKTTRSVVFLFVKDRIVDNSYDLIYLLPDDMFDAYVSKLDIDFDRRERQFVERILKDNDLYNTYVERIYIAVPSGKTRRFQMLFLNRRDEIKPSDVSPEGFYDVVNFMNKKFNTDVLSLNKSSSNEIATYLKKIDVISETMREEIMKTDNIEYFINTRFYAKSLFVLDKTHSSFPAEGVKLVDGNVINSMLFIPDNASIDSILTFDAYEKYADNMKRLKKQLSQKEAKDMFKTVKEHIRKTIIDLIRRLDVPLPEYSLEVVPFNRLKNYKGRYIVFPTYNNLGAIILEYKNVLNVMEMGIYSKKNFDDHMAKLGITDYTYSFGLKDLMEMVYGIHLAASYNSVESLKRVLEIPPEKISRTLVSNISMTIENMIIRCGPIFNLDPLVYIPQSYVYAKLANPSNQYLIVKIT
ncbi:MAG: hypothetical protein N3A54_02230 [Patescibacteria group bacterium]|nr:hypothetical protein [Patescibacteria group bacterium]